MFEPSPRPVSVQMELFPISSSEALHVRTPARPTARGRGSTASVPDCSSNGSALSPSADPVGLALRTFLASASEELTGSSKGWKRSATPAGRSWWVLTTLERTTSDGECGLLPAPRASDATHGATPRRPDGRGPNLRGALDAMLPTPTKRDWRSGKASSETMERNARPLNETAHARGITGTAALLRLTEWMMGYPRGWISVPLRQRTATRSSRKSRS